MDCNTRPQISRFSTPIVIMLAAGLSVPPVSAAEVAMRVEIKGVLHDIMHEGKTGSVAALAPRPGSHTYALGPLAGLAGEFVIVDDVVWVSKPGAGKQPVTTRGAVGEEACLIVSAQVPSWKRITLESDVAFENLDSTVRALAERSGVDVSKPFPFLVEDRSPTFRGT
jgi:hypothetical protein